MQHGGKRIWVKSDAAKNAKGKNLWRETFVASPYLLETWFLCDPFFASQGPTVTYSLQSMPKPPLILAAWKPVS
jgi:hypothetical protein